MRNRALAIAALAVAALVVAAPAARAQQRVDNATHHEFVVDNFRTEWARTAT